MNAMVPDDKQDGSKTVHSWFYPKILLISVDIYVTDDIDTYKITYKCIKKFNVSFEEIEQGWSGRRGFDTWGYSEFLPVNEQTLSHEILFASGSTILVHFKNNNIFIEKIQ
jgi:hypothetical protein